LWMIDIMMIINMWLIALYKNIILNNQRN